MAALGMGVVLVKACGHVAARMEMSAVGLFVWFYLAARDAAEISAGHAITKPDIAAELLVEFGYQIRLLLYFDTCLIEQRQGLFFLLLGFSSDVVWHKQII